MLTRISHCIPSLAQPHEPSPTELWNVAYCMHSTKKKHSFNGYKLAKLSFMQPKHPTSLNLFPFSCSLDSQTFFFFFRSVLMFTIPTYTIESKQYEWVGIRILPFFLSFCSSHSWQNNKGLMQSTSTQTGLYIKMWKKDCWDYLRRKVGAICTAWTAFSLDKCTYW